MVALVLGFIFFAIGGIGIALPGLPTTIFWILAAYCFLRSSEKMYNKVISHPKHGEAVRMVVEEKAMTRKAKQISLFAMWSLITLSSAMVILTTGKWHVAGMIVGGGLLGTIIILSLKTIKEAPAETSEN